MTPAPSSLDDVRERLRAKGYLDAGLERSIFSARRASGAVVPTILTGAAAAAAASAGAAVVAGAISPVFTGGVVVWACLFLLDLAPAAAAGTLLYLWTRVSRAPENPKLTSLVAAVTAAALTFLLFAAGVKSIAPAMGRDAAPAALAVVAVIAYYFTRCVRATVLSLALRRQVELPAPPFFRRGAAASVLFALLVSVLSAWSRRTTIPFPAVSVDSRPRPPLVVVGIDGAQARDLEPLLPGFGHALWLRRAAPPPEIWTTIASGVSPARHGVRAFERVSLLHFAALRPPFGAAWAFRGPLRWIGLAQRLPVSGAERRAYAFWEIAARAGISTVAVNWWACEGVSGAAIVDNSEIALQADSGLKDDRLAVERFSAERRKREPQLATIYLPGADIERGPLTKSAIDFLQREREAAAQGRENLWVIYDGGRGGSGGGILFPASKAEPVSVRPEDIAPSILSALGLPAALDLDGRPAAALAGDGRSAIPPVLTYGTRVASDAGGRKRDAGREYLEKLRSLGYLK